MAKTAEQLRIAAQEALAKAHKLEEQAVEAETKAAQESAIADANRAIGDSVKNAIAAILETNPLPAGTWTFKLTTTDNVAGDFSLCKGGTMPQKGDAPGRVLLAYSKQNPDRVFCKAKS